MRILVTGGGGVLGRGLLPLLRDGGHDVETPSRDDLDLLDPDAVVRALAGIEALYHLATRIPPPVRMQDPDAWAENDRLRAEASRVLVDAAMEAGAATYVVPTVAFVYPPGPADEDTPPADLPPHLRSALVAEQHALRFAGAGGTGVALRLGLLYGPGTSTPRDTRYGATLHVDDVGSALVAALDVPSGVYNVTEDDNPVANERFRRAGGWRPRPGGA